MLRVRLLNTDEKCVKTIALADDKFPNLPRLILVGDAIYKIWTVRGPLYISYMEETNVYQYPTDNGAP